MIADQTVLEERADQLNHDIALRSYGADSELAREIEIVHVECGAEVDSGVGNPDHTDYILETLDRAVSGCQSGAFDAMVTGPVNKATIQRPGLKFTGHTEYLAKSTKARCPVMLLTDGRMRVALVTTHIPLKSVPQSITETRILDVARVLHEDLNARFGISSPRIGVCGLNPHAGESGQLGREEIDTIIPAIRKLQDEGLRISGPFPADTLFTPNRLENFDVILSMYHDQGLPVIKSGGFGEIVNVTLGLPIIRTSVDHGTAYDIAGTGKADVGSLLCAISMAGEIAMHAGL